MNLLLMGFSTTGKSTLLTELKEKLSDINNIEFFDSDKSISIDWGNIYRLYLDNHDPEDPELRKKIIDQIDLLENEFLNTLTSCPNPYIVSLGPNIHTRKNWQNYYKKANAFVVFLKADSNSVYEGLKRREKKLVGEYGQLKGFGNWNQNVTRMYNSLTALYDELSPESAKRNIQDLIEVNERYYSTVADEVYESSQLSKWSTKFDQKVKDDFMRTIRTIICRQL